MLSAIMLNVIMLNFANKPFMLSVVMLSVVMVNAECHGAFSIFGLALIDEEKKVLQP